MSAPSERARLLWEELSNIMKNEEAWEILERHLKKAYDAGFEAGTVGPTK